MFISKVELEQRRQEENNLVERMKVPHATEIGGPIVALDTSKFRKNGTEREVALLTPDLRAVVAAATIMAGAKAGAEIGNVSETYASVLARAEYPRNEDMDPEKRELRNSQLRESIYRGLGEIRDKAQLKLMKVLDLINDDTLECIPDHQKARLAAQMANQLSGVIDRTIIKGGNEGGISSHLHLYAPEQRPLAAFEIKRINPLPDLDHDSTGI